MSNESETVAEKPSEQSVVHTPGPWKVHGGWWMCVTLDERIPISGARTIAACRQAWLAPAQWEANAKLIASSPEMFRIIQRLATADWIGEAELNLWRKECRDIMRKVGETA